ncbi:sulfocyanin-like copper-binding protein, partial [Sulfolobaceae archaeon RB850M]
MATIGKAILVLIFAGTAFMAGFLAYNFAVVLYPAHQVSKAPLLTQVTTTTTTSSVTSTTSPSGAVPLRYDASNHTVFLTVVAVSSGSPFNFNGTSSGQLH